MKKTLLLSFLVLRLISQNDYALGQETEKFSPQTPSKFLIKEQKPNQSSTDKFEKSNTETSLDLTKNDATTIPIKSENTSASQNNIDFNSLPLDVQSRISTNKIGGKELFEGIGKSFILDVVGCFSLESTINTLSFLSTVPGIRDFTYLKGQMVSIRCDHLLESTELKSILNKHSLKFNFISKEYYVIN
jgi:hypothetical protein